MYLQLILIAIDSALLTFTSKFTLKKSREEVTTTVYSSAPARKASRGKSHNVLLCNGYTIHDEEYSIQNMHSG